MRWSTGSQLLYMLAIACVGLAGCSGGNGYVTTSSPIAQTDTPIPLPTATMQPGRVALIAPLSLDPGYVTEAQSQLTELARSSGMVLDVREGLAPGDIEEDWKIVVLLSTPANLNDLVTASPGVQFIVVNALGLQPAQNLSLIRGRPDIQAFLAGFITALVAPDWRAMALLPADELYGTKVQEAFLNGAHYLCGRCSPVYSPIVSFPQWAAMPMGTDSGAWQAMADQLLLNIIYAGYVSPEASSPELLRYLAEKGLVLVGGNTPPEDVRSRWAASVKQDFLLPFNAMWQDLSSGKGGMMKDAEIQVTDISAMFLSPGRQRLVEDTMQELEGGWISPLTYSQPIQ